VLIARREARLDALADEIAATGRPRPLVLPVDLAQPDAAGRIKAELAAHALEPQYIVKARAGIPRVPFPRSNGMPRVVGSNALTCTAEEVAEAGYAGLMRGRRVVVPGFGNKAVTLLTRLLPRRVFLEAVAHSQMMRSKRSARILKKAVQEVP